VWEAAGGGRIANKLRSISVIERASESGGYRVAKMRKKQDKDGERERERKALSFEELKEPIISMPDSCQESCN